MRMKVIVPFMKEDDGMGGGGVDVEGRGSSMMDLSG